MEFVRNAWYVAGWSSEFSSELTTIKVLDEDILIFRNSTGKVHCVFSIFNYWAKTD